MDAAQLPTNPSNLSAPSPTHTPTSRRPTHLPHDHLRRSQSAALASHSKASFPPLSPPFHFLHIICILESYYPHIIFDRTGLSCGGREHSHGPYIGPREGTCLGERLGKRNILRQFSSLKKTLLAETRISSSLGYNSRWERGLSGVHVQQIFLHGWEYSTTEGTSGRSKAGSEGSPLAPLFSASSSLAAGSFFSHIM